MVIFYMGVLLLTRGEHLMYNAKQKNNRKTTWK